MPIQVTMPRLSDTMQQGTIVKWNAKEGQKVKTGDVIADIETDKATMELQSFDDGVVAFVAVPEGQQVPVGTLMLVLASPGEDPATVKAQFAAGGTGAAKAPAAAAAAAASGGSASAPAATAGAVATAAAPSNGHASGHDAGTVNGGRIFASPLARKIAAETGVDLSRVDSLQRRPLQGTRTSLLLPRSELRRRLDCLPPVGKPDRRRALPRTASTLPRPCCL